MADGIKECEYVFADHAKWLNPMKDTHYLHLDYRSDFLNYV